MTHRGREGGNSWTNQHDPSSRLNCTAGGPSRAPKAQGASWVPLRGLHPKAIERPPVPSGPRTRLPATPPSPLSPPSPRPATTMPHKGPDPRGRGPAPCPGPARPAPQPWLGPGMEKQGRAHRPHGSVRPPEPRGAPRAPHLPPGGARRLPRSPTTTGHPQRPNAAAAICKHSPSFSLSLSPVGGTRLPSERGEGRRRAGLSGD